MGGLMSRCCAWPSATHHAASVDRGKIENRDSAFQLAITQSPALSKVLWGADGPLRLSGAALTLGGQILRAFSLIKARIDGMLGITSTRETHPIRKVRTGRGTFHGCIRHWRQWRALVLIAPCGPCEQVLHDRHP